MPGTVDDPVKIGPWKRIKEVHWGKRYFALQLRLVGTLEGFAAEACSPKEQTIHLDDGVPWTNAIKTFRGGYYPNPNTPVSDEDKVQSALIYSGTWTSLGWGDYGVSGLPDWPTGGETSYPDWTYAGPEPGGEPHLRAGATLTTPPGIPVPEGVGIMFDEGLDVAMVSNVNTFTTGMVCTEIFGNPGVFTLLAIKTVDNSSEIEMAFPASSIAVTYQEHTYEAVATKLVSAERVWVLLRKTVP